MPKDIDIKKNLPTATEVVFSFDTTGSMSPCIMNVRKHIEKTCEQLFEDIPNLKIGFIAHGDYCDADKCHSVLPLTNDKAEIFKFIRSAPNTGGGDAPECYELALNLAKGLGWSDAKGGKVLVLIGDASPHPTDYPMNTNHLDWRKELADLKESGVDVYPLQCLYAQYNAEPNRFWSEIAELSGTILMKLDDFDESSVNLSAIAAASSGSAAFDSYSSKIELCAMSPGTAKNIAALRGVAAKYDMPTISTDDTIEKKEE